MINRKDKDDDYKKINEYIKQKNTPAWKATISIFPAEIYYKEVWDIVPSAWEIENLADLYPDKINMAEIIKEILLNPKYLSEIGDFKCIHTRTKTNLDPTEKETNTTPLIIYINYKHKIILDISPKYHIDIYYNEEDKPSLTYLKKINKFLQDLKNSKKAIDSYTMSYLMQENGCLYISEKTIKYNKLKQDIKELYNDDIEIEKIEETLKSNKSGIYIFKGTYGTGKTSLIKYLSSKLLEKCFIYVPNILVSSLDSPDLIGLLLNYQNSVLILEDAEEIITNSGNFRSSGLATLLNICDGFLGDTLNITVIVTFNKINNKSIDPALLRKGRSLGQYEFKLLNIEKTKKLLKSLYNIDYKGKELTLADIFNYTKDIKCSENKQKEENLDKYIL